MQEPELFFIFTKPLEIKQIEYMVTGSVAATIYGEPRITHDIDLVIDLSFEQILSFHELYNAEKFYVPPVEVLRIEASRAYRGHFNLIHHQTGFKADIYLKGEDELHQWAFEKRKTEKINDHQIVVAPVEYVIIRKLLYYREGRSQKHIEDIRNIIKLNRENVNFTSIEEWIDKFGLSAVWKAVF